ncbi:MAG: hypothetical protein A3I75_05910 [Deltaproteobacteria bacterium RIFCSPLOWO2_02_FULL_50_16]|nr:MAG: hypothetical protein A2053_02545 [Deltaproteobacteria bacterium GWA2_50_8]OGQ25927.1 MAG: hypothetical protein A3B79_00200 [Deltaproteobacteria bacterium RIFCSPHIGHO2_02_FULL_50_15]OGQ56710.1 MAG: hypothetical protein A3I75_05910 [Deltaproteobacteria bacterium RIFCSPLOWO2_02_FULL_50_16]OGQ67091.1 MAG: hypothetical protein A3F89_01405 [Deltaproteobacteria bacterium RIFCSPLOWO2_12_FULL_50_11]
MPIQSFKDLIHHEIETIPLDYAALLIAKENCPDLDIEEYMKRLHQLGEAVRIRVGHVLGGHQIIEGYNRYFFEEQGFRGGLGNSQISTNHYLNDVLDNRRGSPISLSILYIEVGRRANIPLFGVNLPGHFIVKYCDPYTEIFIDPSHNGAFLSRTDCQDLIHHLYGEALPFQEDHLRAVTKKEILTQLMTQLKVQHSYENNYERVLQMTNHIIALNPHDFEQTLARGLLFYQLECYPQALVDFQHYLQMTPQSPKAPLIEEYISKLQDHVQIIH